MEIIIKGPFAETIPGAQFERKPHGTIIVGGTEVGHTMQCCHCNAHFLSIRGSGARRGYCMKCMQVTCGALECDVCSPWEKQMEAIEKAALIAARG